MEKSVTEKLKQELDESVIKSRSTDYGTVDYISSSYAIKRANEIFGFDGWSGNIIELEKLGEEEFTKENQTYYHIMFKCIYEIRVSNSKRQDVGFGNSTQGNKGSATETAIKSAVSDSIKRTLRHFGNQFGLSLYSDEHSSTNSSSKKSSQSDNSDIDPNNVTYDTIRNEIEKKINKYGNSKDITEKMHGKLKGFFNNFDISEEKQHKEVSKIIGRDLDSLYDLTMSEAGGILNIIFHSNKAKKQVANLIADKDNQENNEETLSGMELISKVKDTLEEKNITATIFLRWLSEKAGKDYATLDQVPDKWLQKILTNGFWDNNKQDIIQAEKKELAEKVKEKMDKKYGDDLKYSQLYKWYDDDYEEMTELTKEQLKEASNDDFWKENYSEIEEVIPF